MVQFDSVHSEGHAAYSVSKFVDEIVPLVYNVTFLWFYWRSSYPERSPHITANDSNFADVAAVYGLGILVW